MFRLAQDQQLKVMGPSILNSLKKILTQTQDDESNKLTLQGLAYQSIGTLGKRLPGRGFEVFS